MLTDSESDNEHEVSPVDEFWYGDSHLVADDSEKRKGTEQEILLAIKTCIEAVSYIVHDANAMNRIKESIKQRVWQVMKLHLFVDIKWIPPSINVEDTTQ